MWFSKEPPSRPNEKFIANLSILPGTLYEPYINSEKVLHTRAPCLQWFFKKFPL